MASGKSTDGRPSRRQSCAYRHPSRSLQSGCQLAPVNSKAPTTLNPALVRISGHNWVFPKPETMVALINRNCHVASKKKGSCRVNTVGGRSTTTKSARFWREVQQLKRTSGPAMQFRSQRMSSDPRISTVVSLSRPETRVGPSCAGWKKMENGSVKLQKGIVTGFDSEFRVICMPCAYWKRTPPIVTVRPSNATKQ